MQLKYELKKLIGNRLLCVLLILLLLVNALICAISVKSDPEMQYIDKIVSDYNESPDEVLEYFDQVTIWMMEEESKRVEHFQNGEQYEMDLPHKYAPDGEYDDFTLLNDFYSLTYLNEDYHNTVRKILKSVDGQLRECDPEAYGYQYLRLDRMHALYTERFEKTDLIVTQAKGWDEVLQYAPVCLFIQITVILGCSVIFTSDREGADAYIGCARNGRGKRFRAKLLLAGIFGIVTAILFSLSVLLIIGVKTGFSDPALPLAQFEFYRSVPFGFTALEAVLLTLLERVVISLLIVGLSAVLSVVLYRPVSILSVGMVPVVAGVLLYYLSDELKPLKYLNLYGMTRYDQLFIRYRSISFFGKPMDYPTFALIFPFAAAVILAICYPLAAARIRLTGKRRIPVLARLRNLFVFPKLKKPKREGSRKVGISVGSYSLDGFEIRKNLLRLPFVCLLVLLLVADGFILYRKLEPAKGYEAILYREYVDKLSSMDHEDQIEYLVAEDKKINDALSASGVMIEKYQSGEITREEYSAYQKDLKYANTHAGVFDKVKEHGEYLEKIRDEKDPGAEFIYDTDLKKYCNTGADIPLVLLLVLLASGVFPLEYDKRNSSDAVIGILRTTGKGRKKLLFSKLRVTLISSAILIFVFNGIEAWIAFSRLDLPPFGITVLSLERFQNTFSGISIGRFFAIRYILRFAGYMIVSFLTLIFGEVFKKRTYTVCVMAIILAIPYICVSSGLNVFRYIGSYTLLDGTEFYLWFGSFFGTVSGLWIMFGILLSVVALISVFFAAVGKNFCKTR